MNSPAAAHGGQSKDAYWQGQIEAWKKSGLTQTKFCKSKQLNRHTFFYWKRKLGRSGVTAIPTLVPVAISSEPTAQDAASGISVTIQDRFVVHCQEQFHVATLSRLIKLLERL